MAKGKNANPAEAYRKAQKKKEAKRNKDARVKTREAAESAATKQAEADATRRKTERLEQRDAARKRTEQELYDDDGRLLEPERSVYYDPVFNPYGAPPPGMPLRLKEEPAEDEDDDDGSDEDSDDSDDIFMPDGPPPPRPLSDDGDDDDDDDGDDDGLDDIPMPSGPPPPKPAPVPTGPRSSLSAPSRPPQGFPLPSRPERHPFPRPLPPQPRLPYSDSPRSAPANPTLFSGPSLSAPPAPAVAVISAAPQIRDLKKESTSFVPAAIRKRQKEQERKAAMAGLGAQGVVAAPERAEVEEDVDGEQLAPARPNLLGLLKSDGVLTGPGGSR